MVRHSLQTVDTLAHSTAYDRLVMQHAIPRSCESHQCQHMSFQCELPARSLNFKCQYYLTKYALQKNLIELCTWKAANWSTKYTPGSLRFSIPSGMEKKVASFEQYWHSTTWTMWGRPSRVQYGAHCHYSAICADKSDSDLTIHRIVIFFPSQESSRLLPASSIQSIKKESVIQVVWYTITPEWPALSGWAD